MAYFRIRVMFSMTGLEKIVRLASDYLFPISSHAFEEFHYLIREILAFDEL